MAAGNDKSDDSRNRLVRILRVLRPLLWWLMLVLVLYGIRMHERLMEKTRLYFTVSMQWQPVKAAATLDGQPAVSSQKMALGSHTFTLTNPKANGFSTNLFVWYGGRDFGRIDLKRATGALSIQSGLRAARLIVRGPEFSAVFTNSAGTNLVVPTDRYDVEAQFAYSTENAVAIVSAYAPGTVRIAPLFGTAYIVSSHSNTTFRLAGRNNDVRLNGELPATIGELPAGGYELTAERLGEMQTKTLWIAAGRTNDVLVEYRYGAVTLETEPPGASVIDGDGRNRGTTPLTLPELRPGDWNFTLERADYERAGVKVNIVADETNHCQTNLVNAHYVAAMRSARANFAGAGYDAAMESTREALKYTPGDAAATALQRESTGMSHVSRARGSAAQNDLAGAIAEAKTALESIPDNAEAKQLLADCTKRQAELAEQERKRREAELAAQERERKLKELHASFNVLVSGFEDSARFAEHELSATNDAGAVGAAVKNALADRQPSFQIVRFEQPRPGIFALQARQLLGVSYRECFVVGESVQDGETRILLKSVEYDHPPQLKLLGGLLIATVRQDPTPAEQARFQQQIREGAPLLEAKVRQAISELHNF